MSFVACLPVVFYVTLGGGFLFLYRFPVALGTDQTLLGNTIVVRSSVNIRSMMRFLAALTA